MKRSLIWGIATALAIAGATYKFKPHLLGLAPQPNAHTAAPEAAPLAPAVTVAKVTVADFIDRATVSGSIVAREEILVAPEIEGLRVLELFADEGSTVTKGQVLARLVTDQIEAQLAQNTASQARARASIAQASSAIKEAEARASEAKAQFERAEPLKKSGYLSESVFDTRQSTARTSAAQVIAARDGLKAAESELAQIEAQRKELEWRRGNTEVKAPTDGVVSRRNARIGALATAVGEPMFRIISNGELELDAEVVETQLAKIRVGQKARITVPGVSDVEGTVRLISLEIDRTTRLGRAKIFLGARPDLKIGAFARGAVDIATSRGLAVPSSSLMFDNDGTHVQRVDGTKVSRQTVVTGLVTQGLTEIKSGLDENDVVVARSGTFLRDGDTIRPIDAPAADAKTTAEAR
ncbi:MAG: efflux RND transporter periplasmic adaptor subunit [Hyphomicrobium sp.]